MATDTGVPVLIGLVTVRVLEALLIEEGPKVIYGNIEGSIGKCCFTSVGDCDK